MSAEEKFPCPHCAKPVTDRVRICQHCNGPLFDKGDPSKKPSCPRCRVDLVREKLEDGDEAEYCKECRGLWVDLLFFKRATNPKRIPQKYADSMEHWHRASKGPSQYVPCPRCGRFMNQENFSRISGVLIDRCRDHGVWLDAGELERIRLFIANGGLDQLRDMRLDTLDTQVADLGVRTRDLEFMLHLMHTWDMKRMIFQGGFMKPSR